MTQVIRKVKHLLRDGFLHIMTGNFLTKIASFLTSIIIARFIDKTSFAHLTYADNLYQYITYLSGFGLAGALLKYIKPNDSEGTNSLYIKFSIKFGLVFDTILVLLLIVFVFLTEVPFPEARVYVLALSVMPLLALLVSFYSSYLRATLQNKVFAKIGVLAATLTLVFCLPLASFIGTVGVILARYLAVSVIVVMAMKEAYQFKKNRKAILSTDPIEKISVKGFLYMGGSLMVSQLFSNAIHINEIFYINTFIRDPIISANYRVASLIPAQLGIVSHSVIVYYFSIIANMGDKSKIFKKVKETQILITAIVMPVAFFGILLSPWTVKTFFGNQYNDAVKLSYAVWAIRLCNILVRAVPLQMLPAIGKVKFNIIVNMISVVFHFILSYFLIQAYGVYGVVYSALIIYSFSGIAFWIYLLYVCGRNQVIQRKKLVNESEEEK